ncbi:hypothetical protein A134_18110 [Vibrio crassostreae 9CS106]|nr:hypothetical protein A134_18110 [Vibrio crassostreae 9CS106]
MTIAYRSMIALTITTALAGCDTDSAPTVPFPDKPEPLVPAPAKPFDAQIGNVTIKATIEELVITSNTEDDKLASVESFKGIQYAEAQRFEHSEVVNLVEGTLDATQFGYACPQLKTTTQTQDENCLNLNIWRPAGVDADADLPVYVFIHGGDFEYGSGAESLIQGDTVVAQGADEGNPFIYVTFNYRLGLLGSMWVDDEQGGNFGIGDQKRALQWVNENISKFGGKAEDVTLMGQGSGAMSVGILQQTDSEENIVTKETYFQNAIMQSNPYGFEYKSYETAKDYTRTICAENDNCLKIEDLKDSVQFDINDIKQIQAKLTSPVNKLVDWLTRGTFSKLSIIPGIDPIQSDASPMASLMPFAPYIDSYIEEKCLGDICIPVTTGGYHVKTQPAKNALVVPTVLGKNAKDAETMTMLPSLTFLIAPALELASNMEQEGELDITLLQTQLDQILSLHSHDSLLKELQANNAFAEELDLGTIIDLLSKLGLIPNSAYSAITHLFFGLENTSETGNLISFTDYQAFNETELSNATGNMKRFKRLMNDMLYAGPNRNMAIKSVGNASALYSFDYSPSFNVWSYEKNEDGSIPDIGGMIKTIACLYGACNASELPFVFNKAYKLDGTDVRPTTKDKALMNEMSRVWFNKALFNNEYDSSIDNVLVISKDGDLNYELDWDRTFNQSEDAQLYPGRLTGLEDKKLLQHYIK